VRARRMSNRDESPSGSTQEGNFKTRTLQKTKSAAPAKDDRSLQRASGVMSGYFGEDFVEGEHFSFLVGAAGPEEAAEAVAAFARDDVDVKMRDALADDVVHGDERAFRFHHLLHFAREHLSVREKGPDQGCGEIGQSGVVRFRNEQDVPGKKRTNVEKGQGDFVFKNNFGFEFARNDFAEEARLVLGGARFSWAGIGCVWLGRFFAGA
jgi:hypothetical protein